MLIWIAAVSLFSFSTLVAQTPPPPPPPEPVAEEITVVGIADSLPRP
jgi:hypothetical protein